MARLCRHSYGTDPTGADVATTIFHCGPALWEKPAIMTIRYGEIRITPPADGQPARRDFLKTFAAGSLALAAGVPAGAFLSVDAQAQTQGLTKINFQSGWLYSSNQTGEVCAKRMGFYEQEGLELNIVQGGPNVDGLALVAAGRYEVGQLSSSPSLMIAISQNVPIKCFAVGAQQHPFAFFSRKHNPVRSARDFVGKRIGVPPTSLILVRALLAKNAIDLRDVSLVLTGSDMDPLIKGEVDVVSGWLTNTTALKVLGSDRVDLRLWDAGVRLYALPYYATLQTIHDRADLLSRFVRATGRGWEFAFNNREKALELVVAEFPHLNPGDEGPALDVMLSYAFNEATRQGGWGVMDQKIWADQIELFARLGQFPRKVPRVDDVMTMDILNATRNIRPRIG
jgi:NitT/TauT family transport system substrate-binding protein